jgi:protocatechuate 3,4-dioxygenase beta subunit
MLNARGVPTIGVVLAVVVLVGPHADGRQGVEERVVIQGGGPMIAPPRDRVPPQQPPSAGTAFIDGVVVSADLGRPVRRAAVRLSPVTPGPPYSTTSDDAGRFRFESVSAGQFTLSATKPGYLESTFGQRQPGSGRPGTPLSVAAGQRVERLSLPIARGGVLAGMVSDDGGEPAFGTEVQAFRFVWQQGERILRIAGSDTADDRGSFRIGALPPGEYLVVATPSGKTGVFNDLGILPKLGNIRAMSFGRMGAADSTDATASDYAPVFYPGTTSSASAMRVTIGVSEERSGLDVRLPLVPMNRVEGLVMNATGPAPATEVRLIDVDMPIQGLGVKSTMTGPDGRFSFDSVAPGRYRVEARTGPITKMIVDDGGGGAGGDQRVMVQFQAARVGGPGSGAGAMTFTPAEPPAQDIRWAEAEISLAGSQPTPITLVLQPGISVSGRVIFDGSDQPPTDLTFFRVVLNNAKPGEDGMSSSLAQVGADGRFTIEGVTPGTYRVSALSPSNWRARSFNVGGRDALDFLLTVTANREISAAELTLTTRLAMLSGTLSDAAGRPATAHTIIVFPDDPSYWVPNSRRIRATRPATDGRFSFANLPAGAYRLVAVDDLEDGQWTDPNILKQLASAAAVPITVGDGENRTQNLTVAR